VGQDVSGLRGKVGGIVGWKGNERLAILLIAFCHAEPVLEQLHEETEVMDETDRELKTLARGLMAMVLPRGHNWWGEQMAGGCYQAPIEGALPGDRGFMFLGQTRVVMAICIDVFKTNSEIGDHLSQLGGAKA